MSSAEKKWIRDVGNQRNSTIDGFKKKNADNKISENIEFSFSIHVYSKTRVRAMVFTATFNNISV